MYVHEIGESLSDTNSLFFYAAWRDLSSIDFHGAPFTNISLVDRIERANFTRRVFIKFHKFASY